MKVVDQDVVALADGNLPARNYPKNCWWVAARQNEIAREPVSRWFLDRPVVMYRTEQGKVVALDNRCIHRSAPISTGYVDGDNIVCGYHGAVFAPDGKCVHYPTQRDIPDIAKVQAYPTLERTPFIWIWLGDPDQIQHATEPPEFSWFEDPTWLKIEGNIDIFANYFLLQENVLDLTHLNYAHRRVFAGSDLLTPSFKREGNQVSMVLIQEPFRVTARRRPGAVAASRVPLTDHALRREMRASFVSPALHVVDMPMTDLEAGPGERVLYESKVVHCVTPASPAETHYWWIYGQNFGDGPGVPEALKAQTDATFLEDKVIMEAMEQGNKRDERGQDRPQVTFTGDLGGLLARRILNEMLKRENAIS